jgi:hypothetical protein
MANTTANRWLGFRMVNSCLAHKQRCCGEGRSTNQAAPGFRGIVTADCQWGAAALGTGVLPSLTRVHSKLNSCCCR